MWQMRAVLNRFLPVFHSTEYNILFILYMYTKWAILYLCIPTYYSIGFSPFLGHEPFLSKNNSSGSPPFKRKPIKLHFNYL